MLSIIRLIDIVVSVREICECSERTFLYEWETTHLSTVISCVIKRDGAYFHWIYDNYKSSVWRLSGDDYRPIRKSQGYILPKRPGPGRFGSSTYSCGIKVGRLADRHGAGDGEKKREQKGPWRESRLFMTRGGARNPAIPVCLNSQGRNAWSLISLFVFSYRESS